MGIDASREDSGPSFVKWNYLGAASQPAGSRRFLQPSSSDRWGRSTCAYFGGFKLRQLGSPCRASSNFPKLVLGAAVGTLLYTRFLCDSSTRLRPCRVPRSILYEWIFSEKRASLSLLRKTRINERNYLRPTFTFLWKFGVKGGRFNGSSRDGILWWRNLFLLSCQCATKSLAPMVRPITGETLIELPE